ncbi:hypothetical protein BD830_103480 [Maritimibacter alkaliphilus HTCC2654]|uniref:Carbon monoxide dehydrogenase operon G protein n=1 Tax=Maritimibacter alkaliphilus HTCC2654 TaxID=314271 RepID=A3VDL6_9RHOB|nr:carbon monoxide dehydrogenase subunit G [Maritimibacter alkaliphilus]EAQ13605.1 carbon monoxide dehydrogenase operon G protein [Maritimibacter alkaliphilus HTCC2654]TYP83444.1 hypothetical protein BD830_103480 [Maritimibacter alkaliphilus HTCC2654]
MKLEGTFTVDRPRDEVWQVLNDAEVLRDAIPGCTALEPTDDGYEATVQLKVGPVKAKFSGTVTIKEATAPDLLVLAGEGNGGVAGFAKGEARVVLLDAPGGTEVAYEAEVSIGGKLAQLGSRLIASTSRKLADHFFTRLNEIMSGEQQREAS